MNALTHIDLFSGIGGFALAARWAGFKTVCFSEVDDYASAVLRKHWPIVPNLGDIKTADFGPYAGATVLTGGFPCQPWSQAGLRRGEDDHRHLWPSMLGVILAVRPTWIVGENVGGIIGVEFHKMLSQLEAGRYSVQPLLIPACAVGAFHRRDRVWIVAMDSDADSMRRKGLIEESGFQGASKRWELSEFEGLVQGQRRMAIPAGRSGGVSDGVSNRVDRLRGTGNAIVPQVAFQIFQAIHNLENQTKKDT